jgi:hypothetical protein
MVAATVLKHVVPNRDGVSPWGDVRVFQDESGRFQCAKKRTGDHLVDGQTRHPLPKAVSLQATSRRDAGITNASVHRFRVVFAFRVSNEQQLHCSESAVAALATTV